jgi:hypothetical protein
MLEPRDQLDPLDLKVPLANRVLKDLLDHLEAQLLDNKVTLEQLEHQEQLVSRV